MKKDKIYTLKGAFKLCRETGYTLTIRQHIQFDFPVKFERGCMIVLETVLGKDLIGESKIKGIKAL